MTVVWPQSLVIVGCGNMGGAMLAGWLTGGLDPVRVTVVDPVLKHVPEGVTLLADAAQARAPEMLLLGVKPQMIAQLAPGLAHLVGPATQVLSILAGVELATLARLFPGAAGHVRIMPNLAAAIGKSPIALAAQGLDQAARDAIAAMMEVLGTPLWFDESLFDAVTALTGSGPAFVYRFIDALAAGATALGLPADQAQRLALATVEGAGALASASEHAPGELARRVASPGGTTEAGLRVLDEGQAVARLVAATLKAAAERSAEMARSARG